MIGAVRGVGAAQQLREPVDRRPVADGDRQHEHPEVVIAVEGEVARDGAEKTLASPGRFADSNHAASPMITLRVYNAYRHGEPFFIDRGGQRRLRDRSV